TWVVHTRRTSVVLSAVSTTYIVVLYVQMCLDTLLSEETFAPLWPFVPYAGAWGALFGRLFYGAVWIVWIPNVVCFMVALVLSLAVPTGLHHALAQRLRVTDAPGRTLDLVQDVVAKHRRLRLVTHGLTGYFSAKLAHIQIASFITSIFAFI
ncbi:Odorant receptor 24, partial [Frankliniella occidentalis]